MATSLLQQEAKDAAVAILPIGHQHWALLE
jgi:hypothetical protein